MADEMERIEKALEGNGLALSAVAEVLQKMDARLEKEEEDKEEEEELRNAAVEKAALVKELATEVANMLKADQGMDVDGSKERKASTTGGSSSKADDSESAANISSKIEDQQAVIQAMRKDDDDAKADEEEEEYPVAEKTHDDEAPADEEETAKGYKKAGDEDEDEGKEDEPTELENMQKELESLRLQLAEFENGIEKAVATESEDRLRKMGFREEAGLVAPQVAVLGTDGTTPIVKSATEGDTVDQLANLSYGELRALQMKIQAGDTTGVPKELL